MNAMKRFALLGTALMSFLTDCGTQQEHTASSQTMPKTAASADSMKEIAQTGMSTAVPDEYLQPIEQAGTVTQIGTLNQRIAFLEHSTKIDGIGNHKARWEEAFSCWAAVSVKTSTETTEAGVTQEVVSLESQPRSQ